MGQDIREAQDLQQLQFTVGTTNGYTIKLLKASFLAEQSSYGQAATEFLCSRAAFENHSASSSANASDYLSSTLSYLRWAASDPEKRVNVRDVIYWVCAEAPSRLKAGVDVKDWIQTRILRYSNLLNQLPDHEYLSGLKAETSNDPLHRSVSKHAKHRKTLCLRQARPRGSHW
jgi:hypothetical protein